MFTLNICTKIFTTSGFQLDFFHVVSKGKLKLSNSRCMNMVSERSKSWLKKEKG